MVVAEAARVVASAEWGRAGVWAAGWLVAAKGKGLQVAEGSAGVLGWGEGARDWAMAANSGRWEPLAMAMEEDWVRGWTAAAGWGRGAVRGAAAMVAVEGVTLGVGGAGASGAVGWAGLGWRAAACRGRDRLVGHPQNAAVDYSPSGLAPVRLGWGQAALHAPAAGARPKFTWRRGPG